MRGLLFAGLAAAAVPGVQAAQLLSQSSVSAYEAFRRTLGTPRAGDALGYARRVALFERRAEAVRRQNARPDRTWVAGLNRFADYSDEEFRALLGHRPSHTAGRGAAQVQARSASFLEARPGQAVARSVDWRKRLNTTANVRDQGACGSCWAVAAVGALETHAEMAGPARALSYEQLIDCVPNPQECGGQGGCKGATAELAFEYVQQHGLVAESDYKGYQSGGDGICRQSIASAAKSEGFFKLPENRLQPLMEAVATKGPVVVSADASGWDVYAGGVYNGCERDATVNHAILLVGYGRDEEAKKDYWLIRNSWGPSWGEGGYLRLERHASDRGEEGHCGTDRKPEEGVGCKGGPKETAVCGMCGILTDSSYPTGVRVSPRIDA